MRVQFTDIKDSRYKVNFKSIRTDKNTIGYLIQDNKPILANKKSNIISALNNLQSSPTGSNIQFILNIADKIKYGQGGNSEFKRILDDDSITEGGRENTDWISLLADTAEKMILGSTENTIELEEEAKRVFNTEKPLNETQKNILDMRKAITAIILDTKGRDNDGNIIDMARFRQNLDYFISSSEVSEQEKKNCLEKFLAILNGDYKINSQLEDKRFRVADEILNDIIIKRPDEDVLTIKDVSQMDSGICAAISICRKAMAYEDKTRYMEMIMDELSDSDEMEVYDITKLGTGEKVTVPKVDIDYETGLEKGYRIIDISAHQWMQHAQTVGDGSILTGRYDVFDKDNYDVNHDSTWYLGVDTEQIPERTALQALIKEKEYLNALLAKRKRREKYKKDYQTVKAQTLTMQSKMLSEIRKILSIEVPEKSETELNFITNELLKFYGGKKQNSNELNISSKMSSETKQAIIEDFLKERFELNDISSDSIKQISGYLDIYNGYENELKKLSSVNTKGAKYRYNLNLYHLAASHRLAVESNINCNDSILLIKYEKFAGLPPKDIRTINYLMSLQNSETDNEQLASDIITLSSKIPYQLNQITESILGCNMVDLVISMYKDIESSLVSIPQEDLENIASLFNVKPDKKEVIKYIQKRYEKLQNNPTDSDLQESVRDLGYPNLLSLVGQSFFVFVKKMQEGISEEDYQDLLIKFGDDENVINAVNYAAKSIENLNNEYEEIIERWEVPSDGDFIINKLERSGYIISREKLNKLKNSFSGINAEILSNKKIENINQRQKANNKIYEYSQEVSEILKQIESCVPVMKKYCKTEYSELNNYLKPVLDEQYSMIGKLKGEYWVREEGSTGLGTAEQLRIIEQMTGKPHYIEYNAEKAAEIIKEGNGGGILSSSVDDTDYAFHAQYIPEITTESFKNPLTGEVKKEDVLWTDNTWGKSEKEYYWNGKNGFLYTDYGSGYGWKDGFIVNKDMKIGLPVKQLIGAVGEVARSKTASKFGLVSDIILPGHPKDAYPKLYTMFAKIFTAKDSEKDFKKLERLLKSGYKLDIDYLTSLDNQAEITASRIRKRLKNEIKSKEDFDKLPENDELKFYMKLVALYLSSDNTILTEEVSDIDTPRKYTLVKNSIIQNQIEEIGVLFAKGDKFLDTITDKILNDFDVMLKNIIDKYGLNPENYDSMDILDEIIYKNDDLKNSKGRISELLPLFLNNLSKVSKKYFNDNQEACGEFEQEAEKLIKEGIDYIRIKSLDDEFLKNSPIAKNVIDAVDKYLNPSSDEELLSILQSFQEMDYDGVNKFIDLLTEKDIGLNFAEPYELIKQYQGENEKVSEAIWNVIANNVIYSGLKHYKNVNSKVSKAANEYFRHLYVRLSELDIQKHLRQFEGQYFKKYRVRQAFPNPVVLMDKDIAVSAANVLNGLAYHYKTIKSNKFYSEIFSLVENLRKEYSNSSVYKKWENYEDVEKTDKNTQEIVGILGYLAKISLKLNDEDYLNEVKELLEEIYYVLENSNDIINGIDMGTAFNNFNKTIDDWMKLSRSAIQQNIEEEIKQTDEDIVFIANTNIQPRYRNDAILSMKNYIKLLIDGAGKEELEQAVNDFTNLYIDKHISKNPADILMECIKLISEGKTNETEYKTLRSYLITSLNIAYLTGIQFKLVENQGEGINSKMCDLLPGFSTITSEGEHYKLDTNIGLSYLVNQLASENEDYETLKIFLNQSGLAQKALIAVINNFNMEKCVKLIEADSDSAKSEINNIKLLISFIREFNEQNSIKFKNLNDALRHLVKYVERRSANIKDTNIFKNYKSYIKTVMKSGAKVLDSDILLSDTLKSVNKDAIEYLVENVNRTMSGINTISGVMNECNNLINSIEVPQDTEANEARDKYAELFQQTQNQINDIVKKLNEFIGNADLEL